MKFYVPAIDPPIKNLKKEAVSLRDSFVGDYSTEVFVLEVPTIERLVELASKNSISIYTANSAAWLEFS